VTAESRRPLGYGLLGGAAGLTLLLIAWLATSGAQAGGVVLGLVLVFVLAGPLAGAGWYVLARASADVVEERAFVGKQRVLQADKLFRSGLVLQLRQLAAMPGFPAEQLHRIAAELEPAGHDEIARYDTIQLTDAQVAILQQYDDLVWQRVRWLRDHGGAGVASVRQAMDHLQQAIDQRSDLLIRGLQAPSVAPSVLLQASPKAGSAAVEVLDVADAVTYEGSDYVIEGLATGFADGQTWKLAHLVPSGAGSTECWLSVAPGGLELAWLESLTHPPQPAAAQIVVQATSLPLTDSRSAITHVSSTAGTAPGVLVRSWSYRAGSLVGLVEEWPDGTVHAYGGRSITPDAVEVWPASHILEGATP
jgi:hypothetical protein